MNSKAVAGGNITPTTCMLNWRVNVQNADLVGMLAGAAKARD